MELQEIISFCKRTQQICAKRVLDLLRLGGEGNPQGNVQEIKISPYRQLVCSQPRIRPRV